jgi:NAD(P)H-hydrate epimerase
VGWAGINWFLFLSRWEGARLKMRLLTAGQMREADRRAQEEFGLPGLLLMENAAQGAARLGVRLLGREGALPLSGLKVAAVCGSGNNGGDAIACARILAHQGAKALIILLGRAEQLSPDARTNLDIARRCSLPILEAPEDLAGLAENLAGCSLILDGILGTGFTPPLRPRQAQAIELLNRAEAPVLSMDIPSGQEADSGQAQTAVRARATAVFACLKVGMALNPLSPVEIIDIGLPPGALDHVSPPVFLIRPQALKPWLPERKRDGHKGTFGHVFLVGASPGKTGALLLAAQGAQASGAGLVSAALPQGLQALLSASLRGPMSLGLPQSQDQSLALAALEVMARQKASAWVIGPGLGQETGAKELVRAWLRQNRLPVVIDADALNALAPLSSGQILAAPLALLTPHPGEAARLLDCPVSWVQADRLSAAREIAARSGAVCLLKGAASVLARPDGEVLVNGSGNDLLAIGGSGDVLAGLAGGLLAQGLDPWPAGALAAYVHGLAADLAREEGIIRGWMVERLPEYIVKAWSRFHEKSS